MPTLDRAPTLTRSLLPTAPAAAGRGLGTASSRARKLAVYALMPGLSGINAIVGLMVPLLLGPVQFGRYSIAVTLFQYALILDFGISQMIDRRLPVLIATGTADQRERFVQGMLWLRLFIAGLALVAGIALLGALARWGTLPFGFASGALSLTAGLFFMVALGPAAICRASSRRGEFAVINALLMVVLAVARPLGILLGGIVGCFAALAACYGLLAAGVQRRVPVRLANLPDRAMLAAVAGEGVPLFLASFVWAFTMTANRWVVSQMAPAAALGQFAFGSNVVTLIIGAVAALSQFYYPAITARVAAGPPFCASGKLARELGWLTLLVTLPTAFGIVAGPEMIGLIYPKFLGSVAAVRLLLLAVPGLVLASWLLPLALSMGRRPWLEGLVVYPLCLAILMAATWEGYRSGGTEGASWGLVASAMPLLAMQLAGLHAARLLTRRHAAALFAAGAAATACLAVLVWAT